MKNLFPVGALILLVGCAATTNLQHPDAQTAAARERKFTIDNARCLQASSRGHSEGGYERFSKEQIIISRAQYNAAGSFLTGMTNGMMQGAALAAEQKASDAQDAIYKGCMYELGWYDANSPVQKQQAEDAPKCETVILYGGALSYSEKVCNIKPNQNFYRAANYCVSILSDAVAQRRYRQGIEIAQEFRGEEGANFCKNERQRLSSVIK